jgi:DNA-binding response OmpR family regulator
MRGLVVEDEGAIAAYLQQGLAEAGYAVERAIDGAEVLPWSTDKRSSSPHPGRPASQG